MIWTVIYDDRTVGEVVTALNDYEQAYTAAPILPGQSIIAILKGRHASVCRFFGAQGAHNTTGIRPH